MELMYFGDLGKYLDFAWEELNVRIVAAQLLAGLKFMHENDITHRDLRPAVSDYH